MKIRRIIAVIILLVFGSVVVSGCANSKESENSDKEKTIIKAISMNISYPNNSYMIVTQKGTVICADPTNCVDGVEPDIITSTHSHNDHQDTKLEKKFPDCRISKWTLESFEVDDVKVKSIASSHSGDTIIEKSPTNLIYIFEIDGLRIAHMGDIGQSLLTDEQLEELGQIDIAFMQFVNSYSNYSIENEKGFKVIEQLKPQIIIPTHSSPEADKKIGEIVGIYEEVDDVLLISKDDLSDGTRKVVKIKNSLVIK